MTNQLFLSRHSPEWGQLKDDLISLIDANSLAHEADKLPMAVTAEGRQTLNGVFTDRVAGFSACRRLLNNLLPLEAVVDPTEATFDPAETEEHPENIFPAMPPPIRTIPEPPKPKPKSRKTK